MHYYAYATLIFNDGKIRDARNILYRKVEPATIIDFRNDVALYHAGSPDSYSAIIISHWEEITKDTYDEIGAKYAEMNEVAMEELQRREKP